MIMMGRETTVKMVILMEHLPQRIIASTTRIQIKRILMVMAKVINAMKT